MNRLLGLPPRDRPYPRKAELAAPCPEGHVLLHHLCEKCRLLVEDLKKCAYKKDWWVYRFEDTAEDLIVRSQSCHICAMILHDFQLNNSTNSHMPQNDAKTVIFEATFLGLDCHSIRVSTRLFSDEVQSATITLFSSTVAEKLGPRLLSNTAAEWPRLNAQRMRTWLQTCKTHHPRCTEFQKRSTGTKERPTRILRIDEGCIALRCNVASQETFAYTALSHIWGSDPSHQLSLTLSNLLEFQSGIPYQSLPGIHMEAVRLTQALGLTHLWIDALCIIQDSPADWEREASKMAAVYGNAVCNLACISPPNEFRSQLQLDPRASIPCILGSPGQKKTALYAVRHNVTKHWKSSDGPWTFKFDWHDPAKWPLFTRAWTFQEYHLSTRVIFFGQPTLMWECVSSRHDECLDVPHYNIDVHQIITKAQLVRSLLLEVPEIKSWESGDPRIFTAWNLLVSEYRSRAITHHGDRIIALAGIARAIHNLTQLTYLAGLWAEHFPYCLLWRRVDSPENRHQSAEKSVFPGVPSWSWFSMPITSQSRLNMTFERYRELTGAVLTSFRWPAMSPNQPPLNSFYDFEQLSITLRMHYYFNNMVKHGRTSIEEHFTTELKRAGFSAVWYHAYTDTGENPPHIHDDILLGLLQESYTGRLQGGREFLCCYMAGLFLEESSENGLWKRIGIWSLSACPARGQEAYGRTTFSRIPGVRRGEITLI